MKGNLMNRKNVLSFLAALVTALALSSAAALLLREYDRRADNVVPLTEGQLLSFPQAGFSLTVPPGAEIIENETADGALFAASIVMQDGYLRFAAYENATGERIEALGRREGRAPSHTPQPRLYRIRHPHQRAGRPALHAL